MSKLYVLSGLPYAGKSTYIKTLLKECPDAYVYTLDTHLHVYAKEHNLSYNEAYYEFRNEAKRICELELEEAIAKRRDIILDQTNLSKSARRKRVARFGKHYTKVSITLICNDKEEITRRRNSRNQQYISDSVYESLAKTFEMPTDDEPYDQVMIIYT